MKRSLSRYLTAIAPMLLLASASCESRISGFDPDPTADGGSTAGRCDVGVDSDGDDLSNDRECMLGTDPFVSDSDGDGVRDGDELKYPKICVANDPSKQRRPVATCQSDANCQGMERCRGLSPTTADSDGDGVPDGTEDPNRDGKIEPDKGETDPRLPDTDGDGTGDGKGGLDICRPQGLATVTIAGVPSGPIQLGHDPVWGKARPVPGTNGRGALLLEDAVSATAGLVITRTAGGDIRAESTAVEAALVAALGAGVTAVLTGRALSSHETFSAITSTYRIAQNSSASALRDKLVSPLIGAAAPAGAVVGASAEFLMDVTTVLRGAGAGARSDIIVAIAPRAPFEDPTKLTAIRANDLVNTSAVSEVGKQLGAACQVFKADRASTADFLWTVDTSGSMSDDQERLGNTATKFFQRLNSAGVDFRVGVITAGNQTPNLDAPGFTFINGADMMGPLNLCRRVTYLQCPAGEPQNETPYAMGGGQEEPTAAAIVTHAEFKRRAKANEMNPNRRFRDGAKVVAFLVTDEPGSNDFSRYFALGKDPDTGTAYGGTYNAATLTNIVNYFKRNDILTFGLVPGSATPCAPTPNVADLPRCVIEGNGGATIKIETALDAEVDAAMSKIVDAVAGATSQFKLLRTPITSTIKLKVKGREVPRSRSDGFDYDPVSKTVYFFGQTYRPMKGDEVVVSYRVWEGSLG